MDLASLNDKFFIGVASGLAGVFFTILVQQILNKRGLLTYFVRHSRVGVSADDIVFGAVRVTWNGNPVPNLYSSSVELVNQSMRDYENVIVHAFTNDTILLTERTEIVGSTHRLNWTPEFTEQLRVPPGQQPSKDQSEMHAHQRHYVVPILNRGQVIRFHFLNSATSDNQPSIWLDILHKGVKLKFCIPQNEILGVAQPSAAFTGIALGFIFVIGLIVLVKTVWIAAMAALIFGLFAQLPGAYAVKVYRWLRDVIGG